MFTNELISTCNIEWDLCRIVRKSTGEILKDYFNKDDFLKNEPKQRVVGWEMYIYRNKTALNGYITIIVEV